MITAARMRDAWKRLCPSAAPATYRVRGLPLNPGGWAYADFSLTHVARGPLERYEPAGDPEATADTAMMQVWQDDLDEAGMTVVPKRHDLIVQSGTTYVVDSVGDFLFDAVHLVYVVKAGPGGAP